MSSVVKPSFCVGCGPADAVGALLAPGPVLAAGAPEGTGVAGRGVGIGSVGPGVKSDEQSYALALVELWLATMKTAPPTRTTAMTPMMTARYFSKNVGGALTRPPPAAVRRAADRDVAGAVVTGVGVTGALPSTGVVVAGVGAPAVVPPLVVGGWNVRDFLLTGLLVMGSLSRLDEPPLGGTPGEPPEEDHRKGERDDGAGQPGR